MPCDLIAIGSSWGGLTALEQVLGSLPQEFDVPVVIAQHRGTDAGVNALGKIIASRSGREVLEAGDKDRIERGRVYLAPPDYHLIVEEDGFALSTEGAVHHSRPSIDVLFDTAADVYADRLAAVVLTGANDDGAFGISRVRRRGGLTIAQDPADAERSEMPAAAIATGHVQEVLPLNRIGPRLASLAGARRKGQAA